MLRRSVIFRLLSIALLVIGGVVGFTGSASSASQDIAPLLDCVEFDPADNLLVATWGYVNLSTSTETIIVGTNNFFTPPPDFQGQPINFQPGTFHNVFQTTIPLDDVSSETWTVDGFTATATNDPGNYCNTSSGPPGPAGRPGRQDLQERAGRLEPLARPGPSRAPWVHRDQPAPRVQSGRLGLWDRVARAALRVHLGQTDRSVQLA